MELYFKILLFAYFLIIYFDKNKIIKKKLETINNNESSSKLNIRNGENITFGIIAYQCKYCGLFSIFNKNLKCILSTIQKGIEKIYDNSIYQNYWRSIAEKYAPIKQDISLNQKKLN